MGKMKPPPGIKNNPQTYEFEWQTSARRIAEVGLYERIFSPYDLEGKNVLELGTGPGIETEEIWIRKPNAILGLDIYPPVLKLARDYLKGKGYPVKLSSADNSSAIPNFRLQDNSINLSWADYRIPTTISPMLKGKFDYGFMVFPGGITGTATPHDPEENIYPIAVVMTGLGYLMKPGARTISVDRVFNEDLDSMTEDLGVPIGHRLVKAKCVEDKEGVEATLWGNRGFGMVLDGKRIHCEDKRAKPGQIARKVVDDFYKAGSKPGILTIELEKL